MVQKLINYKLRNTPMMPVRMYYVCTMIVILRITHAWQVVATKSEVLLF